LPGNVCHVALRLEGGLDTELLRQRVAASPILTTWRVCASFVPAGVSPVWRAAAQPWRCFTNTTTGMAAAERAGTAAAGGVGA